jgi:hypothetical protein
MNTMILRFMRVLSVRLVDGWRLSVGSKVPSEFTGRGLGGASGTEAPRIASGEVPLRDESAVHEELDRTGGQPAGVHGVVAREGVDLEPVVGGL